MSERTGIAWTDHTFNIAWGCEEVSPGCANCYAKKLALPFGYDVWGASKPRRTFGPTHWREALAWNRAARRAGRRARVFSSSMADVFERHPTIARERAKLWPLVRDTEWLEWQLLTKRPENIFGNLPDDWGLDGYPNAALGTSIENQRHDWRAAELCQHRALYLFISAEPLLGDLDLTRVNPEHQARERRRAADHPMFLGLNVLEWPKHPPVWFSAGKRRSRVSLVIVGGESGNPHRVMQLEWADRLQLQCDRYGAHFFMKQDSACKPGERGRIGAELWRQEMPATAVPV